MAASEDAMVESNSAGMAKVLQENGGYAFFMESTTIEYQVERNCRLTQVPSQPHLQPNSIFILNVNTERDF